MIQKKFTDIKPNGKNRKRTTHEDCSDCPAICCNDLSVVIAKPTTKKEIEDLKWHLNYDTVGVYIRNRRWHLLVKGRCRYLGRDNLCTIYDTRFDTCRRHKPPYCERFEDWYDVLFTTPFELDDYLREERLRWRNGGRKGRGRK